MWHGRATSLGHWILDPRLRGDDKGDQA